MSRNGRLIIMYEAITNLAWAFMLMVVAIFGIVVYFLINIKRG